MITMVELADIPANGHEQAARRFTELGLPETPILGMPFEHGTWRYFAVLQTPVRIDDCKIVVMNDERVAVFHGTDCNMVRRIEKDMRYEKQSKFQYCERSLAGGVFEIMDISGIGGSG